MTARCCYYAPRPQSAASLQRSTGDLHRCRSHAATPNRPSSPPAFIISAILEELPDDRLRLIPAAHSPHLAFNHLITAACIRCPSEALSHLAPCIACFRPHHALCSATAHSCMHALHFPSKADGQRTHGQRTSQDLDLLRSRPQGWLLPTKALQLLEGIASETLFLAIAVTVFLIFLEACVVDRCLQQFDHHLGKSWLYQLSMSNSVTCPSSIRSNRHS